LLVATLGGVARIARLSLGFMAKTFSAMLNRAIARVPPERRENFQEGLPLILRTGGSSLESLMSIVMDEGKPSAARATACWILGDLGYKRAIRALLHAFLGVDPVMTWEAAKAIPGLKSKRAVPALIAILQDSDSERHRIAAAYALGFSFDRRALEPLVTVIRDPAQGPELRGQAAEALGYLRDRVAVNPLLRILSDPSAEVRFWAAFALGEIGDQRALPKLRELVATDNGVLPQWGTVREEAAAGVAKLEGKAESSPLDPGNILEPVQRIPGRTPRAREKRRRGARRR